MCDTNVKSQAIYLIRFNHSFAEIICEFVFMPKGTLDKYNIIPQLFSIKVGIFIPLNVLAWLMTAC